MKLYKNLCKLYFNTVEGAPFELTDGQAEIWHLVYSPEILRAAIKAVTQYGKSETAAMALISLLIRRYEKVLIVAPSTDQAEIIMSKIIQHLFDQEDITTMIDYKGRLEQLRRERSKKRITFKNGSEVMILTADAREVSKEAKNLVGFGATFVLVDERPLIPDSMFSKILRMVGGVKDGKIVMFGNAFPDSDHFQRAFLPTSRYQHLTIGWRQAVAEGRFTKEFLDEAKEELSELDWDIFYEAEFPKSGSDNAVIPADWVLNAVDQKLDVGREEATYSGLDVARFGRDKSVYINRKGPKVMRLEVTEKQDTMEVVGWVRGFLEDDEPEVLNVDVVGVGAGVVDRLLELDDIMVEVNGINVGSSADEADDKERYFNLRAQIWFYMRELFKPGQDGKSQISIPNDPELIKELIEVKYKYSSEKKIKIESKDELKKRIKRSPDKGDALALAFYPLTEDEPAMTMG